MRSPLLPARARAVEPPNGRRDGKKQLDQDNDTNAPERAEYAKCDSGCIEHLRDYDPPLYGVAFLVAHIVAQEAFCRRVPPTCPQKEPQEDKIQPENRQGDAHMDKVLF